MITHRLRAESIVDIRLEAVQVEDRDGAHRDARPKVTEGLQVLAALQQRQPLLQRMRGSVQTLAVDAAVAGTLQPVFSQARRHGCEIVQHLCRPGGVRTATLERGARVGHQAHSLLKLAQRGGEIGLHLHQVGVRGASSLARHPRQAHESLLVWPSSPLGGQPAVHGLQRSLQVVPGQGRAHRQRWRVGQLHRFDAGAPRAQRLRHTAGGFLQRRGAAPTVPSACRLRRCGGLAACCSGGGQGHPAARRHAQQGCAHCPWRGIGQQGGLAGLWPQTAAVFACIAWLHDSSPEEVTP